MINTESLKRWTLASVLTVACAAPQLACAQVSIKRIVVFGTSLSDSGNAFALRGGTNTPPDYLLNPLLIPDVPYVRGGHHFSNGATWIEQYARPLGLAGSVRPSARGANAHATNYAVGAARAREDGINFNLAQQVRAFLDDFGDVAPSDALYVIEMGSNDVRDALVAFGGGPGDGNQILFAALTSIAENIGALAGAGARKILVWNVPNIGLTPAIRSLGAEVQANAVTQVFNSQLDLIIAGYAAAGIDIVKLDVYWKLSQIDANPAAFGLTNVSTACITPSVAPFHCQNVDEYLFWDGIHPTAAAHAIIAQFAATTLAD